MRVVVFGYILIWLCVIGCATSEVTPEVEERGPIAGLQSDNPDNSRRNERSGEGGQRSRGSSDYPQAQHQNPIAGTYRVPSGNIYQGGQPMCRVDQATITLREDKTFSLDIQITYLGTYAQQVLEFKGNPVRREAFEGFWSVDGRRLALESNKRLGPEVIMLDSNLRGFNYDWSIPDSMLGIDLHFRK